MVDGVAWALVHGSRLRPMMVVIRPRPESPPMKHSGPEEVGPDALPIRLNLVDLSHNLSQTAKANRARFRR
jgi:hypothetical protein